MMNKLTKYGVMIIAAVLLVALTFAGAASADTRVIDNADDYLTTFGTSLSILEDTTYYITDGNGWAIPSLHNAEDALTIGYNVTLDFTNFTGPFEGITRATAGNGKGALFGNVSLADGVVLNIIGLNMTGVTVMSSGSNVGGIMGVVKGGEMLNFIDCHQVNCSVTGASGSSSVGGLIGYATVNNVTFASCSGLRSEVISSDCYSVGGLVGNANAVNCNYFTDCLIMNSTISSNSGYGAGIGGLVGYASHTEFRYCEVENSSIYQSTGGSNEDAGGILGAASYVDRLEYSNVTNCVVVGRKCGGLVGCSNNNLDNFVNCTVVNSTIYGSHDYAVGGLIGLVGTKGSNYGNNKFLYSAVSGYMYSAGHADVGGSDHTGSIDETGTIKFYSTLGTSNQITLPSSTFWKSVYWGGSGSTVYTTLGRYGQISGYGVVRYNVSIDGSIPHGSLDTDLDSAAEKAYMLVTALSESGYHLNWTYYNKTGESDKTVFSGSFIMPRYDVNVSGNFLENVTTVYFYANNASYAVETFNNTYHVATNVPAQNPFYSGFIFSGWNVSAEDGTPFNSTEYNNGGTWNYTGPHCGMLDVYANWTLVETNVTVTNNTAEFHNENTTVIQSATGTVCTVLLENVSQVTNATSVNFTAGITIDEIPDISGNTKEQITVFEINATPESLPARFNMTVTFADEATATADKGKIHFWHYNTTIMDWDRPDLTIAAMVQTGEKVLYTVETYAFSPFGFGIYTPIPPQYTPSSSHNSGYTVILPEGQAAPTQQPTAAPTVVPTTVPTDKPVTPTVVPTANPTTTPQTPAPFAGLVLGLGAAAVLLRLRR